MAQSVQKTVEHLRDRATKMNALVDKRTHPRVSLALQSAYAGLTASAQLVPRIVSAAGAYVSRKVRAAKAQPGPATERDAVVSAKFALFGVRELLASAAAMSRGRDAEAFKHLGAHGLELAVKVGAVVSGVKTVTDVVETLEILKEAVVTRKATKLRRQQVRAASDLLRWADAVTLTAMTWCFAGELFLLGTVAKGRTDQTKILDHTLSRITRNARSWKAPERQ